MRLNVIGKPRRRVDGRAKVTGLTKFADDIVLPRMLHCRLLRSPHPHIITHRRIRQLRPTMLIREARKNSPRGVALLPRRSRVLEQHRIDR